MVEAWKRLEGQVVDGTFQLSDYLGGTQHSAVFLTNFSEDTPQLAAIKIIPENSPHAQERLACWRAASTLFHQNLIQIFQSGHCEIEGEPFFFVVMEYAEENLGQIVPQRALTEEEVSMLLVPTLNALEYLQASGLVHGRIRPADIMAMGDRLKVSTDGVQRPGEAIGWVDGSASGASGAEELSGYGPPEGRTSAAGDVWSLGVTLVEVLTQRRPQWDPRKQVDPVVPENLPRPLLDIARNCLRRDPKRRWTIAGIGNRLKAPLDNPLDGYAGAVEGLSGPGVSTVSAALGAPTEVALPDRVEVGARSEAASAVGMGAGVGVGTVSGADGGAGSARTPSVTAGGVSAAARSVRVRDIEADLRAAASDSTAGLRATMAASSASAKAEAEHSSRGYLALAVIIFLVMVGLLGFKLLHQGSKASSGASTGASSGAASEAPQASSEETATATGAAPSAGESAQNATPSQNAAGPPQGGATQPQGTQSQGAPSQGVANQNAATNGNGTSAGSSNASGVVHQVIPEASEKSLGTIRGTVRVGIRVTAGASGEVTEATVDSQGPSEYFANLALGAARQWKFAGSGMWKLRFEFSPDGAKAFW